ncbi:MAG TPA: Dam family site-specific DNA-(adenine-N6)-methyltransferase [Candidatus Ornithoclostridium excrementipullorum]|nr:Dam family site-specific DNA-(adenine-N6)-methyltransferase [Candidatus Ornithoclostridium excrementipullorum]
MSTVEPFVRWAGGKTWLIPYLPKIIGDINFEHYHEPFLGGAAVFFSLNYSKLSYLSDSNDKLVNTYLQIRDNPQAVIKCFVQFQNSEKEYYRIRDEFIPRTPEEAAAQFIYLNQTSYNGLFRVNKQGEYNVPYGFRTTWHYDIRRILDASEKLKNTRISVGDFEINKHKIKKNDLVFLDPPYTVSHNNNGFIEYNRNLFSLEDQKRLSRFIDYIKRKNAYYILTNAAHEEIKKIFTKEGDILLELRRKSLIGGRNASRKEISEYIFTNIPQGEKNNG